MFLSQFILPFEYLHFFNILANEYLFKQVPHIMFATGLLKIALIHTKAFEHYAKLTTIDCLRLICSPYLQYYITFFLYAQSAIKNLKF